MESVSRCPHGSVTVGVLGSHICSLRGNSACGMAVQVVVRLTGVPSVVGYDMEFRDARNKKQILVRTVEVSVGRASAVVAPD